MENFRGVYISHLIDKQLFCDILEDYPVGIETIEFSISSVLDLGRSGVSDYVSLLNPYISQRPLSLHGPFFDLAPASFDSRIRQVTMERFNEVYQIARELKAERIIYHSGFVPTTYYIEGWLGNSIAFWKEFLQDKDGEIQIHVENVFEKEFWPLKTVIDEVSHPNLSICLDIGHVHAYSSKSLEEWIEGLGPRIGHIHLHNNNGEKDEHRGLEQGSIDIGNTLRLIERVVPNVSYTLEISDGAELRQSLAWLIRDLSLPLS